MDLSRFSVAPALLERAAASDPYRSVFYERVLSELFEKGENLFVKTDIKRDRASIFSFALLHWLYTQRKPNSPAPRALYLCAEDQAAKDIYDAAVGMADIANDGLRITLLIAESGAANPESLAASGNSTASSLATADCLIASVAAFDASLERGELSPREFGFVVADQAELLAEQPGDLLRRIQGHLLPSWERKSLVIANKHTPRSKNFAWDFADNPKEIKLAEALGFGGSIPSKSIKLDESAKLRVLLSLARAKADLHLCVFCNLKSTAVELSARLVMNGLASDYIGGNLNPDRKRQIVDKALGWKGPYVLVLTDEGAKTAQKPGFSSIVNYDIPLEPELYFDRLAFLDRDSDDAMVYNLVCERYMYGIPAIERIIQSSLAIAPLDMEESLPEDLSAGKEIPMPEGRFRGRDDRRGSRTRDDRHEPFEERRRDSEDFRRRPERRPERELRRSETHAARAPEKSPVRELPVRDPYAMSMEERLAFYKRRYGKRLEKTAMTDEATVPHLESQGPEITRSETREIEDKDQNQGKGLLGKLQNLFGPHKD